MKNLLILVMALVCTITLAQNQSSKQTSLMREGSSLVKFKPRPVDNYRRDIGGWHERNNCRQNYNSVFIISNNYIENREFCSFGASIYTVETHTFWPKHMCAEDAILIVTSIAKTMNENVCVTEYGAEHLILLQASPNFIQIITHVFNIIDCEHNNDFTIWRQKCKEQNVIEIGNLLKIIINK